MGLFSRRRRTAAPRSEQNAAKKETRQHLEQFVASRVGVEAFIEPETPVTQTTIVLIATDGEWTRRRVPDGVAARSLATELKIPVYDVNQVGYPQRMRDWNSRQRGGRPTAP